MIKVPKVMLELHAQSKGRGVGVYGSNLLAGLKNSKKVKVVSSLPDIVHYTYFDLFYPTLIINSSLPSIVTVHDVTPLVMSDRYPKGIISSINLLRQWYQLKKANAIITDSECSKNDISNYLRIDKSKIFVTYLSANSLYKKNVTSEAIDRLKKKYSLPETFILTVAGGPNPNKNLPNLAEATERIGIPLVIIGGGINQKFTKPVAPELIDLVRLEVYQHLIRLDNVSDDELLVFYKTANLYVQASLYEGFGIPLLEAMTAGCPIVSSKKSSLPEIYHNETLAFNPKSLSSMEKVIRRGLALKGEKLKKYILKNKEKSRDFSWDKTTSQTIEVYKKVYENINK